MNESPNRPAFEQFLRAADSLWLRDRTTVCLDLGSRDGEIARYFEEAYPQARIFAFECNPQAIELCRRRLAGSSVVLVEKAVADVNGPLTFRAIDPNLTITPHADGNIGASSLYVARDDYPLEKYVQRDIVVEATTLATWAREAGITAIDVIWMDLQGAELRALRGLDHLLDQVRLIYTEVQYKPIYHGQPTAQELRTFLRARGFTLIARFNQFEWSGDELYCHRELLPWWRRMRLWTRP